MAKDRYKNVSRLARDVGGGRMLAPGEIAQLADGDRVRRLVDAGRLVKVTSPRKTATETKAGEAKPSASGEEG